MSDNSGVISVRFADPWIADNQSFLTEIAVGRNRTLDSLRDHVRPRMIDGGFIKNARPSDHFSLAAVDAAICDAQIDDVAILLVQAARHIDGVTDFDPPFRFGPFSSDLVRHIRTPARMARETALLAASPGITIADNSLWSFLMEFNQAITARHNVGNEADSFCELIDDMIARGDFLRMLQNENIIAMPKLGISQSLSKSAKFSEFFYGPVTDRAACSIILDTDEYLSPQPLSVVGKFGVERRFGEAKDSELIQHIYENDLFFTYYKPWPYKQAYRIEGRKSVLSDALFASVKDATKVREIAEPVPQFMVDHAVKQLSGIATLYSGDANRFRMPFFGYHRTAR